MKSSYEELMMRKKKNKKEFLLQIEVRRFKHILERCKQRKRIVGGVIGDDDVSSSTACTDSCPDFLPMLIKEMSIISTSFNRGATELLQDSGFLNHLKRLLNRHEDRIKEGGNLIEYAAMNVLAIQKLLEEYDEVHHSEQGQTFKAHAQKMSIDILHSPWFKNLITFYINKTGEKYCHGPLSNLCIMADVDKPSLTCTVLGSLQVEIDLTCPVCLELLFDVVSLTCGHMFCYFCACSAASVIAVHGLRQAGTRCKCPLCRQEGVYEGFVRMNELNILLSRRCPEYWKERLSTERVQRVQQAKHYWEHQCRSFAG